MATALELQPQAMVPEVGPEMDQEIGPAPSPLQIPEALNGPRRCPSCGGSGVLRLSAMRFRTCLDCAGQGLLPVVPARSAFEPQPQWGQALDQLMASTRGAVQPRLPAEGLFQDLPN